MSTKKIVLKTTTVAVDTSDAIELEYLALFEDRARLHQRKERLKSYRNGAKPLFLDESHAKSKPIKSEFSQLKAFPKKGNLEALRYGAEHGFDETDKLVEILFGEVTEKGRSRYYSRRTTTWKKNGWVEKESHGVWKVTDELREWLQTKKP